MVVAGLLVGSVLAEAVFWVRDGGAFPHVNFYTADDDLGARLAPNRSERIAFGGNPITTIATNARGYRGDWPADARVLVVGDSQVFGLGVEGDQTLAAHLANQLGQPVLNGGVPTYGPAEYLAIVDEVAESQPLETVVLVINYANDLFEVNRPNRERHIIWDGWAVRTETAPSSVIWFPGRSWLFSRSHLVFALRKWMHQPTSGSDTGFPSEGTATDVLSASKQSHRFAHDRQALLTHQQDQANQSYAAATAQLGDQSDLLKLYLDLTNPDDSLKVQASVRQAEVGDIVGNTYAESSRSITVTAEILAEGARLRRNLRAELRKIASESDYARADIHAALSAKGSLDPDQAVLRLEAPWSTPLDTTLDRFARQATQHGFKPVVVALPLDVQVLPSQFKKYGAAPQDLSDTHVLFDDLKQAAALRGLRYANPLQALKTLGDRAFLQHDLHLSGPGQAIVARQIQAAIESPPPVARPTPRIIKGRSRIPWIDEWEAASENKVRGSTANRCHTLRIREWFRMDCRNDERAVRGMRFVDVPLETHGWYDGEVAVLIAPVLPGRSVDVDLIWADATERFHMEWEGEQVRMGFDAVPPSTPQQGTTHELSVVLIKPTPTRPKLRKLTWLGAGRACDHGQADCLFGTRRSLPTCPPDKVNAGSGGHCFASCSTEIPCDQGVCTAWGEGAVCL